jgi:hypothetical protein
MKVRWQCFGFHDKGPNLVDRVFLVVEEKMGPAQMGPVLMPA